MSKTNLRYYLCGGTAINIGKAIKEAPATTISPVNKQAEFVALDASDRNDPEGYFEVVRMPANDSNGEFARGSGKVQSTNYGKAQPFIKDVLSKHTPGTFNVVICNAAGGSGSMLGVMLVRELIGRGIPTVVFVVSDHTSVKEMQNSINILRSLSNQASAEQLNKPIPFLHAVNDNERTRAEVNKSIINELNMLSIFLSEDNEEADYEDILNLFNYSSTLKVPPALSRISFYSKADAVNYEGKPPVAYCSLFNHRDNVIPRFQGGGYRVTGVFGESANSAGAEEFHMLLDHGEFLDELKNDIEELESRQATKELNYSPVQNFGGGDDNGMCFE